MKVISFLVLLTGLGLMAQPQVDKPAFKTFFTSDAVLIHASGDYSHFELTVEGPDGFVETTVFEQGQSPVIDTVVEGIALADGDYTFQMRAFGVEDRSYKGSFQIRDGKATIVSKAAATDPALHIDADRNIGIGTSSPTERVHVKDTTAEALFKIEGYQPGIVVERTDTTTNNSVFLLELINNGQVNLRMNSKVSGLNRPWILGVSSNDDFFISRGGTGQIELELDNTGNLTTQGTVNGVSDINMKRDFAPVSPQAILAKLVDLPLSTWSYKNDEAGTRHLGPMAQDFYAAFGLGMDARHISFTDTAGVAFGAIQGLHAHTTSELEDAHARIAVQDKELAALKARLKALEQHLSLVNQ